MLTPDRYPTYKKPSSKKSVAPLYPFIPNRDINSKTIGFSAVRAMEEPQYGIKGRIHFENTFANLNRGWISKESLFQCHVPGE